MNPERRFARTQRGTVVHYLSCQALCTIVRPPEGYSYAVLGEDRTDLVRMTRTEASSWLRRNAKRSACRICSPALATHLRAV